MTPRTQQKRTPNIINHFALVLDRSTSMEHLRRKVIEMADNQIKHWATRSKELNQETRVSVWTFAGRGTVECVIWDMDVLRLPSIAEFYNPYGNTALVDAMLRSISDLDTTSQIYGDHSFLMFVITDGRENDSTTKDFQLLPNTIKALDDNWTVAALVPDANGVHEAKRFGFPAGNIQIWDATSTAGLEEAAQSILRSADAYMTARSTGMRSTTGLFDMSAQAVNKATIKAAGLKPLPSVSYMLVPVPYDVDIRDFTEQKMGHRYVTGRGYYQLGSRMVKIQVQKEIAVHEKASGKVYTGQAARQIIGLPDITVSVKAGYNPDYDIFVQSTSTNRKLIAGTKYLYLVR